MSAKQIGWCVATIIAMLAASTAVFSQAQPRAGAGAGAMLRLTVAQIPVAALEAPLALSADQKTKIGEIQTRLAEERRATLGQGAGGGDRAAAMQRLLALNTKAVEQIRALLTAEQKEKLPGVVEKMQVLRDVGIPLPVVADLKLTEGQMTKLGALAKDLRAQRRAAGAGTGGFRELQRATRTKAMEVLTAEQKVIIQKHRQDNPMRGGAGGGGQNR